MVGKQVQFVSIDQAILASIKNFKQKIPIMDSLSYINSKEEKLTEWVYEKDIFLESDFVFFTSEEELFLTDDDILDYYDESTLRINSDSEIIDFIKDRLNSLEYSFACHYQYFNEVLITAMCEIHGQAGPHFSHFNIFNSEKEYFESLVKEDLIVYQGDIISRSESQLVDLFRKNITDKYFKK